MEVEAHGESEVPQVVEAGTGNGAGDDKGKGKCYRVQSHKIDIGLML